MKEEYKVASSGKIVHFLTKLFQGTVDQILEIYILILKY